MDHGFYACASLSYLHLSQLTDLGRECFAYCHALRAADVPLVKEISEGCFSYCYSLQIGRFSSAETIATSAFKQCYSLKQLQMPCLKEGPNHCIQTEQQDFRFDPDLPELYNALVLICDQAEVVKLECKRVAIKKMHFGLNHTIHRVFTKVAKIPAFAFENFCSLEYVSMPETRCVGENSFKCCYNLRIVRSPGLIRIQDSAFENCFQLFEIDLKSVKQILGNAFMDCFSLNNVDLSSVKDIKQNAFSRCKNLKRVKCGLQNKNIIQDSGRLPDGNILIHHKWDKVNLQREAAKWRIKGKNMKFQQQIMRKLKLM
uniref:Leucine rich repeats-containing protein n=1 Tax=Trepomonas sp. PC1 TaxID=1076344 RepID=A0A146KC04_9EUKA|eukprot:JAP93788.1 Leucine rich repeats-containing protein [Trepomonas sp. PC1]